MLVATTLPQIAAAQTAGEPTWVVAACQMAEVCNPSGACAPMPVPGTSYIFRDASGAMEMGRSRAESAPVPHYDSLLAAEIDAANGRDYPARGFLVIGEEDEGPGFLSPRFFSVTDAGIAPRHFRLVCETSDTPLPEAETPRDAGPTGPSTPEGEPDAAPDRSLPPAPPPDHSE